MAAFALFVSLALGGCSRFYQYSFVADAGDPKEAPPDNISQPGFFILRYQAYQGTNEIGGTLNEIGIRNISETPLNVDLISLDAIFKGRHVTKADEPIHYTEPGVFEGRQVTGSVIGKGGWMYFVFPTERITDFSEGDEMKMRLNIRILAGTQKYSREFAFAKKIIREPPKWP